MMVLSVALNFTVSSLAPLGRQGMNIAKEIMGYNYLFLRTLSMLLWGPYRKALWQIKFNCSFFLMF